MSDTERPETSKETLRRVLAPLNLKHNGKYRKRALLICLPGEFCFLFLNLIIPIGRLFFGIFDLIFLGLGISGGGFLGHAINAFYIFIPHFIANTISITKRKTDIFFEMSIVATVWTVFFSVLANGDGWDTLMYYALSIGYRFAIVYLLIAEVIFYAVAFKKERAKAEQISE
jgi:hypothetical protein